MDTANHPAPQRHAKVTPARFPSRNGTDSRYNSVPTAPRSCFPYSICIIYTGQSCLQKSHVMSAKRALRTRLPPAPKASAALPSSFAIPARQNHNRGHQCHSDIHPHQTSQPHDPLNNSTSTPPTRTKYCAGYEKWGYHMFNHVHVFSKICTTLFGMILTRPEHTPIHQSRSLAETCHESTAPKQQPERQIPMSQLHPTPQKP